MLKFDHIALAADRVVPLQQFLAGRHGGVVIGGGSPPGSGFRAMQIRIGRGEDGMTIELLEPWEVERNDFLARFLSGNGPGPHHFTFKTADIQAELKRFEALGFDPVGVNFSNSFWQEFFIHPNQGHGPVIQVAQPGDDQGSMTHMLALAMAGEHMAWGDAWWSATDLARGSAVSTLEQVVIATPDLEAGVAFYGDVLGGVVDRTVRNATITWSGGTVMLEQAGIDRPRVDRLELSGDNVADDHVEQGTRFVAV